MINFIDFMDYPDSYLFGEGLPEKKVAEGFKQGPDWLPDDYKAIFTKCDCWALNAVEFYSPVPAPRSRMTVFELNEEFQSEIEDAGKLFAIGYAGDDDYLVLEKSSLLTCGYYNTEDGAWFGEQYGSFTAWAYSCLESAS